MKCLLRLVVLGILAMIGISFILSEQGDVTTHIARGIKDELLTEKRVQEVIDAVVDSTVQNISNSSESSTLKHIRVPYQTNTGIDGTIHIYSIDAQVYSPQVVFDMNQPKTIKEWAVQYPEDIITNASYFHPDLSASGFVVADGTVVSERIFDLERSGALIHVQGQMPTIRDLTQSDIDHPEQILQAVQSYPYIIKHGQGAITEDSGLRARRTAVGIDAQGNWYIIVVEEHSLTLYQLMNALLETHIPFQHVLNLDGGPSTGLVAPQTGTTMYNYDAIPGIIRFRHT